MIIESNTKKNNLISVVLLIVGLTFLLLTAKIDNPDRNQKAAYLLGLLLSSLSGVALINQDQRKIEVQSNKNRVVYTQKSLFGAEEVRMIPFNHLQLIGVTGIGRRDIGGARSYFIYLKLKNGETISTGYSSFDEHKTKELAAEIAQAIGCEHSPVPIRPLDSELIENAILAGFIAALSWMIFYRFKIGPWCEAMWFGTAPGLFMLSVGISSYYFLKIIRRKYKK